MSGVVLVLAHAHDAGASAVATRLRTLVDPDSVVVVRPEALGLAMWSHTISPCGDTRTWIQLPGGASISSESVDAVFNRLQYLPLPRFHKASPKDRDYADAELQALVASWLLSFGTRAINPVGPRGLSRGPVSQSGWLALAASIGLPVVRSARASAGRMLPKPTGAERIHGVAWPGGLRGPAPAELHADSSSADSVLVVGDRALGALAQPFGKACVALARVADCTLLEVRFAQSVGGLAVCGVNAMPRLLDACEFEAVAELCCERRRPVGAHCGEDR
jgi:hypothetical protein